LYVRRKDVWKIGDFDITSSGTSGRHFTTVYSRGTASYRAPELLSDVPFYTNKSDIWAVGCILYELVTAEKAFVDDWAVKQHIEYQKRVALPETEHVTIKDEIEWAINATFESDCAKRPSIRELQNLYFRMLSGRPQRRVDARTIPAPVATGGSGQSSTDLGRQSNDLKKGSGFVARHGYYVYITTLTGKTIAVRVNGLDTIHKVKEKVKAEEGIPTDQQALRFDGHSLEDKRTVAEYEIKRHSRLQLILCPPRYTVFVKILDGESITGTIVNLSVRASETIFNVKAKIREAAHVPIDQQSLTLLPAGIRSDSKTHGTLNVMRGRLPSVEQTHTYTFKSHLCT
jgi:serine/threonine protein kinase